MILPTQAITEFLDIYRRRVGGTLTNDEAGIRAESFLRLMELLVNGPQKENQVIDLNKNEK